MAKNPTGANNQSTPNILLFKIYPPEGSSKEPIDVRTQVPEIRYYEDVLSNTVSMSVVVVDTGGLDQESKESMNGILDGLPIKSGCRVDAQLVDPNKGVLNLTGPNCLYVSKVVSGTKETQKDIFQLELVSVEYFINDFVRIRKSYQGKISDSVRSILTTSAPDGIGTQKPVDVEETLKPYRFIGNTWKPFKVCTWLAAKSNPQEGTGHQAGFLFFETHDGFKFKSIDSLLKVEPTKKFQYTNTPLTKNGYQKIQYYNIEKNSDLDENLKMGTYNNKTTYFDPVSLKWKTQVYGINDQKENINLAADNAVIVNTPFTNDDTVTRYYFKVLDIGYQPLGDTPQQQLSQVKSDPKLPNHDSQNIDSQSLMRYHEIFSIKTHITILGDFTLRAGETVHCEFPDLQEAASRRPNEQTSGKYMVSSLCHRLTPKDCHTSITLVRDSLPEQRS